jgi:beta-glucuronidase
MATIRIILALIFLPAAMHAQNAGSGTAKDNITSLNGKWNYIVDPYETGYYSFHSEVYDQKNIGSPSAFYNNYHAKNKAELVEYDFDKSPLMTVPGDWNTQSKELFYYEGTVWYKKSFDYSLKERKRLFVYFGAVNYKAEVYLNGKKLGTHIGGFTPFHFEITDVVKEKANYLVVKADNRRMKDAVPTTNTDWWNYGGITRDVWLTEKPAAFIQDYAIHLNKTDSNTIAGFIKLEGAAAGEKISLEIPGLNPEKQLAVNNEGRVDFSFSPAQKITCWTPENPKLYKVILRTSSDTVQEEIGFKTIEAKGADLLLNGKPIFLRGISLHEEIGGRRAYSEADAASLLKIAKELGCNYVRLAHYPHNENTLRMADKMGLLVWEEIPVYWTISFGNSATYDNAANQLSEMIARDKNRASVIVWSVANETPSSEARNSFLINLIKYAKQLDSTRLVSAALLTRSENGIGLIDDTLGNFLDIIAFNEYRGWYGGDLATAPDAKWKTPYNKPVIVSEFGGDAKQGLHGDKAERWTEEYQQYLYQQNLLMIEKIPNLRGLSPWILMDFRSPRRLLPGVQDGFNRKGLVSDKGIKKKAFFTLQSFYRKKMQYK